MNIHSSFKNAKLYATKQLYNTYTYIYKKWNYYMKQTTTAHIALIYTIQTLYYTLYKYYLYTEQQKK